ncbi:hypothetical protein NQ317_003371 [Molorchus minor]|uniref:Uncharacterized protein n=1 Tax=Molorchus minor TaxID=1323400 RepID=A0ABQ9K961_9CUCU|nr:hypothetical protein NQ317_003371 [Molorchus minor]
MFILTLGWPDKRIFFLEKLPQPQRRPWNNSIKSDYIKLSPLLKKGIENKQFLRYVTNVFVDRKLSRSRRRGKFSINKNMIVFGYNSCLCQDAWESFHANLNTANREELVVTDVTTNEDFNLDYKVRKWTSHSVGFVCYSVGLMDAGLVILFSTLTDDRTKFNFTSQVKGKQHDFCDK